jgi:BirA family biotin operon repressor/biotin-[acetyl-CoA-carboxylase] ligase
METLFVGKNLIFLPITDSTNSYAIELLKNVKPVEGTVVQSDFQTKGRGQRGSVWNSEPSSNLAISVILHPSFLQASESFYLYMIAALSCYDTTSQLLADSQVDVSIKWPNDIYVNRLKLGGILIENKLQGDNLQSTVIGIGLNINQILFEGLQAISFKALTGKTYNRDELRDNLLSKLEQYYLLLKNGKKNKLRELYVAKLLGQGEQLEFLYKGEVCKMTVLGISDSGLIRLKKGRDEITADLGELRWLI